MNQDAVRNAVEVLLSELLDVRQARGCVVEDERGDAIAAVGALGPPDAMSAEVPLMHGGRLVIWFVERSALGIVRTRARSIEQQLSALVLAHERALVRPPRTPGSA